jgi:TRAP-type mannitol/chloroaromatic compound transport system substrate-binding protein
MGDLVVAARKQAADVLADVAGKNASARKIHDSYVAFRDRTARWSDISIKAVLEAREG